MLTSTGDIKNNYRTLGALFAFASEAEGCSGLQPVPVFQKALGHLMESARKAGATGIIHVGFTSRVAVSSACFMTNRVFEVIAWGTAVQVLSDV